MRCSGCVKNKELERLGYDDRYDCSCGPSGKFEQLFINCVMILLIPGMLFVGLFLVFVDWVIDG